MWLTKAIADHTIKFQKISTIVVFVFFAIAFARCNSGPGIVKIEIQQDTLLTENFALALSKRALTERKLLDSNLKAIPIQTRNGQDIYFSSSATNAPTGYTVWEVTPGDRSSCYVVHIRIEGKFAICNINRCK